MTLFAKYSNTVAFQSMNYTTLGPKFYAKLVSAITRRRSKLWWRKAHQSKALDASYFSSLSKRDLEHSGTNFSKNCMRPWIRSLWNILPKSPLRDDFLTFETSKNMFPGIFIGFDICNLKLFPIKNRSSIVPSLQKPNVKKCHFRTNVENKFWPVLQYVKNTLNSMVMSILAETF